MNNYSSLSHRKEEPENGILYIVGTPIGNLNDISQRALNILKNVSLVACEDTRQTRKIMNKFNISNKLISLNQHNSSIKNPKIIKDLKEGKSIAIVSDAGMPGICDPGEDIAYNIKSEGLIKGVIQVPADGNPIIMLSDHGTIGGYPKIGVVISADYDKLVQLTPGSKIKFKKIELADAETLFKLYDLETQNLISQI